MIKIINYGLGNVLAFYNLYKSINIDIEIASTASELSSASKIILPGVGTFDQAMIKLNESGMGDVLDKKVLEEKIPVLGICVGMQIMLKSSQEGNLNGLSWVDANVIKFNPLINSSENKIPHMGWNSVNPIANSNLLDDLDKESEFYFLHSYYCDINDDDLILATTNYQKNFTSIFKHNNIYGIQCHPEKSHDSGITLLKNFSKI